MGEGGQKPQVPLSLQLVKHSVGYIGDISQMTKHPNPHTLT